MFIKTVSTTSGINPIKFDETGGVFYWILNTGSSTIYASTKSTFTAGDDGAVSLGPKESRRLETNNDTIYILGEGQVEIHNQRDGICSFKQAPTSSGGGGTIDAYSKTESDAKYAAKSDVPDAYTKTESDDKYAQKTDVAPYKMGMDFGTCTTPAETVVKSVTTMHKVAPALGAVFAVKFNNAVPAQARLNINGLMGYIQYRGGSIPNGVINAGDIATFIYYSSSGVNTFEILSVENGGNADTVDGLHANDFTQIIDFGSTETDTKTAIGQLGKTTIYRCTKWTDYPAEFIDSQGTLIAINYNGSGTTGTDWIWCTQIIVNPRSGTKMFIRYIDTTFVSDWKEISTTPIKSTTFSGTTDNNSICYLWEPSENKIPIAVMLIDMLATIFYSSKNSYGFTVQQPDTHLYKPNIQVSGTVYYIEI